MTERFRRTFVRRPEAQPKWHIAMSEANGTLTARCGYAVRPAVLELERVKTIAVEGPECRDCWQGAVLDVTCPACHALKGQPCTAPTDTSRKPVAWFHSDRTDLAVGWT